MGCSGYNRFMAKIRVCLLVRQSGLTLCDPHGLPCVGPLPSVTLTDCGLWVLCRLSLQRSRGEEGRVCNGLKGKLGLPRWLSVCLPLRESQETRVWSPSQEDPLERETHSSVVVWKISWTEKPGRLESMGWQESDVIQRLNNTSRGEGMLGRRKGVDQG